jgi:hypothetical protein
MLRSVPLILLAPLAFAQITAPSLGLLPDGAGLRPVIGIPAAGVVGDVLPISQKLGLIVASRDYALGVDTTTGDVLRIASDGTASKIAGVLQGPGRIQMSPLGSSAALFFPSVQRIQVLTGLPAAPTLLREIASPFDGTPSALAVSDDGTLVAGIWPQGSYLLRSTGEVSALPGVTPLIALAFAPGSSDLAVVSAAAAQIVKDSGLIRIASFDTPISPVAAALTKRQLTVAATGGSILLFDLASGVSSSLDCQCSPQGLFPLGQSVFRLTGLSNGAFKILDTAQSAVWQVPLAQPPSEVGGLQ